MSLPMEDGETVLHAGEDLRETLYHLEHEHAERLYLFLVGVFVTLLVLTNVIGVKLFYWFDQTLTTGLITYPLTFLVTDIVSEIYGRRRANRMVLLGFAMSWIMLLIVQAAIHLPPSPHWSSSDHGVADSTAFQKAWAACFGMSGWLVTGSMLAYMVAQLCDNFLFHFWRRVTNGRHLWLRNNGSTIISQLIDTFIVNSFLFYGAFGWELMQGVKAMAVIYLFKLGIALADTPFCYLGVWGARRYLRARGAFA